MEKIDIIFHLYKFLVLPFKLKNASEREQRESGSYKRTLLNGVRCGESEIDTRLWLPPMDLVVFLLSC